MKRVFFAPAALLLVSGYERIGKEFMADRERGKRLDAAESENPSDGEGGSLKRRIGKFFG